jgi:beta-lactamase regulating signal transducer with metallopeptidase domain
MTNLISLDAFMHALGWTIVHSLWQGVLVAIAAAILLHIYRQHTAHIRYWVACGGMVTLLLATITTFGVLLSAEKAQNTEGGVWRENSWIVADFTTVQTAENQSFVQEIMQSAVAFFNAHLMEISIAWLVGFLFFSTRLVVSWAILRGRRRASGLVLDSDFWQVPFQRLLQQLSERQLSIRRPVRLVAVAWTLVPLTVGWLKPVIFIPLSIMNRLSPTEVAAILAHELAHIAHRDYLLNCVQALVEAVFYYHPTVWWLSAVIRTEREMRCDAIAISLCNDDKIGYAKTLVRLQEHAQQASQPTPQLALAFGKRESSLSRRVKHLFLSPVKSSFIMERITITSLLVASLFLFSFVKNQDSKKENDLQNTSELIKEIQELPKSVVQNGQNTEGVDLAHFSENLTISEEVEDTSKLSANTKTLPVMTRVRLLRQELTNDGLIKTGDSFIARIHDKSLTINGYPVLDQTLIRKYFQNFVPYGDHYTYSQDSPKTDENPKAVPMQQDTSPTDRITSIRLVNRSENRKYRADTTAAYSVTLVTKTNAKNEESVDTIVRYVPAPNVYWERKNREVWTLKDPPSHNVQVLSKEQIEKSGFSGEKIIYKVNDEQKKGARVDTAIRINALPSHVGNRKVDTSDRRSDKVETVIISKTDPQGNIISKVAMRIPPKGSSEKEACDTIPNSSSTSTAGITWEKVNGVWKAKLPPTNASSKTPPSTTPPNAQPGRCYAQCMMPDGNFSEWREVVCQDLIDNAVFINALRDKLIASGDLPASHTERAITKEMKAAIVAYQKRNKLPVGNLNEPTMTHMGITMPRHPAPVKKD